MLKSTKNIEALKFDNSYARLPNKFYSNVEPTPVKKPNLIKLNTSLASNLGLNLELINAKNFLSGNSLFNGSKPIAMVYAGHQFGHWVPQLGDGRAILLGEIIDKKGDRQDIQLKGCGPTPFSRMGDGRAWLGPILREYVLSESMESLGVPTTRALSVVLTGENIFREQEFPGAILTRVAYSHIRVGTFQYFAARQDLESLKTLADYVINRHYVQCKNENNPYLELLKEIIKRQAQLVSKWMGIGFIHGVMNTDNTSIYGETIDYGPCAFMDEYSADKVFSSIDQTRRYSYKNQPEIIRWNLACLASSLLPLISENENEAITFAQNAVDEFPDLYKLNWLNIFRNKLGLVKKYETDEQLINELLNLMEINKTDYTLTFRGLASMVFDDDNKFKNYFLNQANINDWVDRWRTRLSFEENDKQNISKFIKTINPAYIARNHRVEEMIQNALSKDYSYFETLTKVLSNPYDDQLKYKDYQKPPEENQIVTQTFCGT
jgi:serine/tyrosine/threonine adenylyltransferase